MTEDGTTVTIERVDGAGLAAVLDDVARLRMQVFRAFPYLYEGDAAYERRYLSDYAASKGAVVVLARGGDGTVVGAATAEPMGDHQPQIAAAFRARGLDPATVFYLGESVLEPAWRGHGVGHRFFDEREAAAREQGFSHAAFCAVVRPADHPARPADYRPLDPFWCKRGYTPVDGLTAPMRWPDLGETTESEKPMQFWMRAL